MQEEDLPHPWGMEAGGEFLHRGEWQPHNQACEWHQAAGRTFPLPLLRQGRAEPSLFATGSVHRKVYFHSHPGKRS